ncbi:MAG: PKD domain-containing protein [Chitinophagaceae bacterium]|nr:PKD domain-containing protein [Chitinophagaceae bacterium]
MAVTNEYRVDERGFTMQLDKKVIFTFLAVIAFCVVVTLIKLLTAVDCHLITIKTSTSNTSFRHAKDQYYTGEVIQFIAASKGATSFEWDFGDGSPKAISQTTTHAYLKPGNYSIEVKVNKECIEFVELLIVNSPQTANAMADAMKSDKPYIMGPEVAIAGEPCNFQDLSQGSTIWDWSILNTPDIPAQTSATATFVFPVPGTKIINLVTNGDPNRSAQKTITIIPKQANNANAGAQAPPPMMIPPPMLPSKKQAVEEEQAEEIVEQPEKKKEEKPLVPVLPDMEFKNMIENMTNGKTTPEAINAFLCNGTNTKVHRNGEWDTWGNFAREISGKKRVDIKSVKVYRDENNCVTTLEIEYKKRLL